MKGSIKIVLPQEAKGLTLGYAKIAETAGEGEDLLRENMEYTQRITVGNKNTVELTDLEEGVYQMQIFAEEEYEFMPSVVSIPMWDENKEEMQYEFTVIPKYIYHEPEEEIHTEIPFSSPPETGDGSHGSIYGLFGIISFIIILIISCHKRFRCGRMTHM